MGNCSPNRLTEWSKLLLPNHRIEVQSQTCLTPFPFLCIASTDAFLPIFYLLSIPFPFLQCFHFDIEFFISTFPIKEFLNSLEFAIWTIIMPIFLLCMLVRLIQRLSCNPKFFLVSFINVILNTQSSKLALPLLTRHCYFLFLLPSRTTFKKTNKNKNKLFLAFARVYYWLIIYNGIRFKSQLHHILSAWSCPSFLIAPSLSYTIYERWFKEIKEKLLTKHTVDTQDMLIPTNIKVAQKRISNELTVFYNSYVLCAISPQKFHKMKAVCHRTVPLAHRIVNLPNRYSNYNNNIKETRMWPTYSVNLILVDYSKN